MGNQETCPYCDSPSALSVVYRDSNDPEYRAEEWQCGLPVGSPDNACGRRWRLQTDGSRCLGSMDDICIDPTHDHLERLDYPSGKREMLNDN